MSSNQMFVSDEILSDALACTAAAESKFKDELYLGLKTS
jgi:hypothetical protein